MKSKFIVIFSFFITLFIALSMFSQNTAFSASKLAFWFQQGESFQLFDDVKLAPSRSTTNKFAIKNHNNEPIKLSTSFHFELQKDELPPSMLKEMITLYEISGELTFNNEKFIYEWLTLEEFSDSFSTENLGSLLPNNIYEFEYTIRLSEAAGNLFQGATLFGELNVVSNTDVIPYIPPVDPPPGGEPEKPGTEPENPGTDPEGPGTEPEEPGTEPEEPGTDSEIPGTDPENPGTDPDEPGNDHEEPGINPEEPKSDSSEQGNDKETEGGLTEGNKLPKTATNVTDFLFIGFVTLLLGIIMLTATYIVRKRGVKHDTK